MVVEIEVRAASVLCTPKSLKQLREDNTSAPKRKMIIEENSESEDAAPLRKMIKASAKPTPILAVFSQLPCWRLGAWLRPVSRENRHFTGGGGRLCQSGPRPEGTLLRQPTLEGLMRSAWTDSPRQVGRNKFRRSKAAAATFEERKGAAHLDARARVKCCD
ncbi:hypothetical protein F511_28077 [Dorcoceras hygrometricum]|uniref:Uncharacterized protein n=1 Tax=Dorcoceras hygrometricum TaxID=472368 RepID=A0A2Z7CNE5_9LAMI|nr:hypothetical protein F511_28077 [Dorcoceras hygrometricum]